MKNLLRQLHILESQHRESTCEIERKNLTEAIAKVEKLLTGRTSRPNPKRDEKAEQD
jgi:hypothetical protein